MRNTFIAALAGSLLTFSGEVHAQPRSCKADEIIATGRASLTEAGARRNAIENWRREVLYRYGESWAEFELARDATVARCAHTSFGILLRCEARGKPCEVPLDVSSPLFVFNPTSCTSRDSKGCDPRVKTMQAKLTAKGCPTKVDGAAGPATSAAIRCFQQKEKLPVTGNLDLATAQAINR